MIAYKNNPNQEVQFSYVTDATVCKRVHFGVNYVPVYSHAFLSQVLFFLANTVNKSTDI